MSRPGASESKVLTIGEAAAMLRISRNTAYAAARLWRQSGGREGLPCIEIGRVLRVPRAALQDLFDCPPANLDRTDRQRPA